MLVLGSIASLWLIVSPAATESPPSEDAADLSEAKRLFDEGTARYDAADFAGAIEVFTLALSEVRGQGVEDFRIRGLLLFNIGRTHMRAYEIDDEVEHLRQARSIFKSFVREAERHPDQLEAADIAEAEVQLQEIDRLLAERETEDEPAAATTTNATGDRVEPDRDPKQLRAMGIGFTAAAVALLGGGIGMLAWGAGFGPAAEADVAQLDDLGLPSDSPAFADADAHVASERGKGAAWMAGGGVAAALGVAGIAVGIRQLVVAKRIEQRSITPTASFGRNGVFVGVSGRF